MLGSAFHPDLLRRLQRRRGWWQLWGGGDREGRPSSDGTRELDTAVPEGWVTATLKKRSYHGGCPT